MDWRRLPKVELHLHLECSLSYSVVSKINPSITMEEYRTKFIAPAKCVNLVDCLSRASQGVALMQTEEQLREDNLLYAEIRFAPLLHIENGLSARDVVAVIEATTAQAVRNTGIEARLILCTLAIIQQNRVSKPCNWSKPFAVGMWQDSILQRTKQDFR